MKTKSVFLLAAIAVVALSGCASSATSNFRDFVKNMPAVTATDIAQSTNTPVYAHSESASGVTTDPTTGLISVTNGKASVSIPELGVTWQLSISGLKMAASPEQLAAGAALAAAQAKAPPEVSIVPLGAK